jgi:hypothetical protein
VQMHQLECLLLKGYLLEYTVVTYCMATYTQFCSISIIRVLRFGSSRSSSIACAIYHSALTSMSNTASCALVPGGS